MWEEVSVAKTENRRELVLSGKGVGDRVAGNSGQLDQNIFQLVNLNFLEISGVTALSKLSENIINLENLTTLLLKGNHLEDLPVGVGKLSKLKVLDVSMNKLSSLPSLAGLTQLTTLNVSINNISGPFPDIGLDNCSKLSVVDVSVNKLENLSSIESCKLEHLSEMIASKNSINCISGVINANWPVLKKLDLAENSIKVIPGEIGDMPKLKELFLLDNPISDNRLKKMASQKTTKSVMEYIRQHCSKAESNESSSKGGGKKGKKSRGGNTEPDTILSDLCDSLTVMSVNDKNPELIVTSQAKDIRPYVVICFVRNIDLTGDNLRKFITAQTKLHKGVCGNRTLGTIATHDLASIKGPLTFTAKEPDSISIQPLTGGDVVKASKLVERLKVEAEKLRKEKKRSTISGVHQYLPLLERKPLYPCLLDAEGTVISFPPVTNSYCTRISSETTDVLMEVTSSTKLGDVKAIADTLLKEMLELGLGKSDKEGSTKVLTVEQGRVVDEEGSLKVTYPSKTDLAFPDSSSTINVERI